jgi:hypothetical protein
VKEHENCDFRTAVHAIDNALKLGLFSANENPLTLERERMVQKWLDQFVDAIRAYCQCLIDGIEKQQKIDLGRLQCLEDMRGEDPSQLTQEQWEFINYFDENDDYAEYRKEVLEKFIEGVAAWRRMYRGKKVASV